MRIVGNTKHMKGYGDPWNNLGKGNSWVNAPLIGYDCETTGPEPKHDRIVSAAIVLDDPETNTSQEWSWLCNPEMEIMREAIAVHGISNEYVQEKGRDCESVIREIMSMINALWHQYKSPLVCVNSCFDLTILRQEAIRLGIGKLENLITIPPVIDTLVVDRKLDPYRRGRRTLTAVSANYSVTINGAHTAIGDIKCAIKLARKMGEVYPHFGNCDLDVLQYAQAFAMEEWIKGYESYKRLDNTGFTLSFNGWPYQEYDD